jgi:hypothetical protein
MLRSGQEDLKIGTDAALHLPAVFQILIEQIFDRGDDPVVDGAAERPVSHEPLRDLAFVILLPDALLHPVEVDTVEDLTLYFVPRISRIIASAFR